jgi:hypothetical protein
MDHTTAWIDKEGKRLLLCQPYRIDDIGSLADACVRHGLRAFVHSTSWYGHGTVAIELRPREVTSDG